MNKIKLKKRTWINADGKKGSSYRFFYNDHGEKKYIQSPNRKYLEGEAKRILFRLDNVKSEYPLPLEDTWEAYYKQQKTRMYEKNRKFSQTTLNEYECHYNNIFKICGNIDLRGVHEDYIGAFLLKLKPKYVDHKLTSGFAKMSYRKKLFDTFARIYNYHVGYGKPFKSNIFKKIILEEKGFSFCPEVTTKLSNMGIKIIEIPISYNGRNFKEGKKIRFKDALEAGISLIKYKFFKKQHIS